MSVIVKFDPTVNSKQAQIIPDKETDANKTIRERTAVIQSTKAGSAAMEMEPKELKKKVNKEAEEVVETAAKKLKEKKKLTLEEFKLLMQKGLI